MPKFSTSASRLTAADAQTTRNFRYLRPGAWLALLSGMRRLHLLIAFTVASLAFAQAVPSKRKTIDDDASIPEVAQREYLITDAGHYPRIQTTGMSTCYALSLYDRKTKTGLLAHIDAPTRFDVSLERMLQEFSRRGIAPTALEARVIGGETDPPSDPYKTGLKAGERIFQGLAAAGITVVERDLGGDNSYRSITLDLNDGVAYDYVETAPHVSWEYGRRKGDRLWDAGRKRFCDGTLYRHEDSLPSVGVPTDQPDDRMCF
ncbi:MAG: hypothetical protein HY075_08865 [Deltaproteobacteria bacterium]|nr:hypothetical protein [Deltaproteobacteria bacterium]